MRPPPPAAHRPVLTHQALPFLLLPGLLLGLQLHHRQGRPHGGAGEGTGCKAGQQAQPTLLQAWRQGPLPGPQPIAAVGLALLLLQLVVVLVLLGALIWRAENRGRVRGLAGACAAPPPPLSRSASLAPHSSPAGGGSRTSPRVPPMAQCPHQSEPKPWASWTAQRWAAAWGIRVGFCQGNTDMHLCCGEGTHGQGLETALSTVARAHTRPDVQHED